MSELLTVATDTSTGDGLIALSMRRSAVQALVAMSKGQHAKIELKNEGAMQLASDLLESATDEGLRRGGATLACNLCLHPDNKHDVVASPLFTQIMLNVQDDTRGAEDEELCSRCRATKINAHMAAAAIDGATVGRRRRS